MKGDPELMRFSWGLRYIFWIWMFSWIMQSVIIWVRLFSALRPFLMDGYMCDWWFTKKNSLTRSHLCPNFICLWSPCPLECVPIQASVPSEEPRGNALRLDKPQQDRGVCACFYTDGHSWDMISAPSVTQKPLCLGNGTARVGSLFMCWLWLGY